MQALVKKLKLLQVGDTAVRRNPLFYADAQREFERLERAGFNERRKWTHARLSELLWPASRSGYGMIVRGGGDIASWPLLSKSEVRGAPEVFAVGSQLFTIKANTGGTSGAPLDIVRSLRSVVVEQVCIDRMMQKVGIDARSARCAVLRTESIKDPNDFKPPYWIHAAGGNRLVLSSTHLNAATIEHYARAIDEFAPECLLGYPTSLEALCFLLKRAKRRTIIPAVLCSSEVLHPRVWQAARETLNCQLLDYYGQAERVAFAYATAPGQYRFLPGYAHVEFEPAGVEGEHKLYEIIGTPLWNRSMALIRYRTGDLIRLPAAWGERELEEVALGLRPFSGVLGRDSDILVTPDGVKVTGISHFQRDVANIVRIQVIQESASKVVILVLPTEEYSDRDRDRLMNNVREKLPRSMHVEIRSVTALERTARGKTPFVIHRPPVKELLNNTRAHGNIA
ncbi:AMP-binding protein [Steroidobacter flavus]|uniref:AMP-binding protein n=1 Tax=Steroidobacter flavus TaxID=1842136 RepID=A0ABV8SNI0_9GAMM